MLQTNKACIYGPGWHNCRPSHLIVWNAPLLISLAFRNYVSPTRTPLTLFSCLKLLYFRRSSTKAWNWTGNCVKLKLKFITSTLSILAYHFSATCWQYFDSIGSTAKSRPHIPRHFHLWLHDHTTYRTLSFYLVCSMRSGLCSHDTVPILNYRCIVFNTNYLPA